MCAKGVIYCPHKAAELNFMKPQSNLWLRLPYRFTELSLDGLGGHAQSRVLSGQTVARDAPQSRDEDNFLVTKMRSFSRSRHEV